MRGMNEFEFPKRGRGPRDQHGHEHGGHGGQGRQDSPAHCIFSLCLRNLYRDF